MPSWPEGTFQLTIGVTGTINVGVMTVGSLVFDVLIVSSSPAQASRTYSSRDCDTSSFLLGGLVDSTVVHEFSTVLLGQVFCDSGSQCSLSVINVLPISSTLHSFYITYTNSTDARSSAGCAYEWRKSVLEMRLLPAEFTSSLGSVAPDR